MTTTTHTAPSSPRAPAAGDPPPDRPAAGAAPGLPDTLRGPANGRRRQLLLAAGAVIALVVLIFGGRALWYAMRHESTDDAQVDGHIDPVSARVGGFVTLIKVHENQPVREGDTLLVLDQRDLLARLAQANANYDAVLAAVGSAGRAGQAVAQLDQARAAAAAAQATVAQAEANAQQAQSDLERYQTLAARHIISQQQLDVARTTARATAAQLTAAQRNATAAQEQVTAATAALSGSEARLAAARAARDQVALQLSYTVVTAPIAGVVSKKSVEPGQFVEPGQPLMAVVPLNDVWVTANYKETQVEGIQPGAAAVITADAYPGMVFHGTVESLSPATGAKFSLLPPDNATGNFTKVVQRIPVRIFLDAPADPGHPLRPGMSVTVSIRNR